MAGARRNVVRRVVLAFTQVSAPQPALRTAADIARLLSAELHGLLVEDEALFAAAALPFTRLLDPALLSWEPLSDERLRQQYAAAASVLRRHLLQAAEAAGVVGRFTVVRGDPIESLAAGAEPEDLVAMLEAPGSAAGRLVTSRVPRTGSEDGWPAVLHVPQQDGPRAGPVVAVVASPDDPSLPVAAGVAQAAHEKLLVVDLSSGPPSPQLVMLRPRLIVMRRALLERSGEGLGRLLGGRGVPWLLLGRGEQVP